MRALTLFFLALTACASQATSEPQNDSDANSGTISEPDASSDANSEGSDLRDAKSPDVSDGRVYQCHETLAKCLQTCPTNNCGWEAIDHVCCIAQDGGLIQ